MHSKFVQIYNKYTKSEERSFTIIAFPVPEIGDNFEEIFADTIKINTLDYMKYRESEEMYLETILLLQERQKEIRSIDIANEETFVRGDYTFKSFGSPEEAEYIVFIQGTDDITASYANLVAVSMSNVKQYFDENSIVGIFLQGSQNYGLDYEGSDIDTKLII